MQVSPPINRRGERLAIGLGSLAALLLLWEAVSRSGLVDPLFISSPLRVVRTGADLLWSGEMWSDLKISATEFLIGYLGAIAIGILLGLAMGWSKRVQYIFGPFVDTLNALPRVTLLPLLVIWFGIGIWSKVIVVFLGAVIPILVNTQSGVEANEARYVKVARSFGASELKMFVSIVLPGAVPFIFTGLKYGAGRALLGVVVGELYAATSGVGHMIADAGNSFQTDVVFVGILLFTVTGLATVAILNVFERRFENWRPKVGAAT
jgi:ABC-type nitrate/sulfonate/bicarbonate transport system permease component